MTQDDGTTYTGTFKNGILHGEFVIINEEKKKKRKLNYIDGKRHGYGEIYEEGEKEWVKGYWNGD